MLLFFGAKQPLHVKYYFNIVVFLQNVYKWGPPGTKKKKVLKQKKCSPFRASKNNLHVNCCDLTRKDICGCFIGCWRVSSSAADNTSNTAQSLSKDKKKIQKTGTPQTETLTTDIHHTIWECFHFPPCQGFRLVSASQLFSTVGGWRGRRERGNGLLLPPLLPPSPSPRPAWCLPSPELIGGACVEFRAVWVTYGMGCRHGWMLWDGARAGEGKGHWRLSSVSDRENAVTTSSAPENQQRNVPVIFIWSVMVRGSIFVLHMKVFFCHN